MRRVIAALAIAGLFSIPVATSSGLALAARHQSLPANSTFAIYDSIPTTLPGNLPSVGGEAYAFSQLGNQVGFDAGPPTSRSLDNVTVTLSSWGCQSGSWFGNNCVTSAGATFTEPITFNVYNVGPSNSVGSLIATDTQTFAIPYRPSYDSVHCMGGEWYQASTTSCFNGMATNITFDFSSQNITLPNSVIYGVAYNTTHYGQSPYGESTACYTSSAGCGYDSLNIALSNDPTDLSVGSDPIPGTLYQNAAAGGEYCDGGTAGINVFRLDAPACWGENSPYNTAPYYIPAVSFNTGKFTPTGSWAPHTLAAGGQLGPAQLDASASVAGTWAYTPGAGTVITNTTTVHAVFTPSDSAHYHSISFDAMIPVGTVHTTVVADNQSVVAGESMPSLTSQTSPIVPLDSLPTCSTNASSDGGNDSSAPGSYAITCSGGSGSHVVIDGYTDGTLEVTDAPMSLAYNKPASGAAGKKVTVKATLSASDGAEAIESLKGLEVDFVIGTRSCSANATAAGTASCKLKVGGPKGTKTVTASFGGDSVYQQATASHKFVVK